MCQGDEYLAQCVDGLGRINDMLVQLIQKTDNVFMCVFLLPFPVCAYDFFEPVTLSKRDENVSTQCCVLIGKLRVH